MANILQVIKKFFPAQMKNPYNLIRSLEKEGLLNIFYKSLKRDKKNEITSMSENFRDLLESMSKAYYTVVRRNVLFLDELKKINNLIKECKVEAVLTKGVYLVCEIYKDVGLRGMTDVDILIRKTDLAAFSKLLFSLGYNFYPGQVLIKDMEGNFVPQNKFLNSIMFEKKTETDTLFLHLHWNLSNAVFNEYFTAKIPTEYIWKEGLVKFGKSQSSFFRNELGNFYCLTPEFNFLYLCCHTLKHFYNRLVLLYDLAMLLKKVDFNKLAYLCTAFKVFRPVFTALILIEHIFNFRDRNYRHLTKESLQSFKPVNFNVLDRFYINLILSNNRHHYFAILPILAEKKLGFEKHLFEITHNLLKFKK